VVSTHPVRPHLQFYAQRIEALPTPFAAFKAWEQPQRDTAGMGSRKPFCLLGRGNASPLGEIAKHDHCARTLVLSFLKQDQLHPLIRPEWETM